MSGSLLWELIHNFDTFTQKRSKNNYNFMCTHTQKNLTIK